MTGLSRLHWVNNTFEFELFNCEPDDVVVVRGLNFIYRFGDQRGASYNYVSVSRQRSDRHDAPIDMFSNVIRDLAPRRLTISVDPLNRSVRRRFPWINPAWYNIDLVVYYNQQTNDICLQTVDVVVSDSKITSDSITKYSTGHANEAVAKDSSTLDIMLDAIKKQTSVVKGCLYGYRSKLSDLWLPLKLYPDYGDVVQYNDVDFQVIFIYGSYAQIKKAEAYLQSSGVRVTVLPPDTLPCSVSIPDIVKNCRLLECWHPTSLLRWPRHRSTLFDVALTLGQYLPPYVLLEIVDWLPLIEEQSRLKKVEVLEGVCQSMRRMDKLLWYN